MILAKTNAAKFAQIWIEFFELEKEFGDVKHQRKLLNRALNEVNMDEKEVIYEVFFRFEKYSGNVQQQANIYFRYEQFKEVSRVIAARKKVKTQQKEAGQLAEVKKDASKMVENGKKVQQVDRSASLKRKVYKFYKSFSKKAFILLFQRNIQKHKCKLTSQSHSFVSTQPNIF